MIFLLAVLGCSGAASAPPPPPAVVTPTPVTQPEAPTPTIDVGILVGLPFIHKGLYTVTGEGDPALVVALVQVSDTAGGGYTEEWLLTDAADGIANLDFTGTDVSAKKPYEKSWGKVGKLSPYPNRLPWTSTPRPDPDHAAPLTYHRRNPDDLVAGGLKAVAWKTVLKDNVQHVHYVTADVTTQAPSKPSGTEDLEPTDNKPRHWNEVFYSQPLLGRDKRVGYMYAEGQTTPASTPPNRSTRVWELVNSNHFTSDIKFSAPTRVETGYPAPKEGDPEPLTRDAWYDQALAALGGEPKDLTLVSGTAIGYDSLPK